MTLTLVTGAQGWLGLRLVRALVEGLPDVPALATPDPERRIRCLVRHGSDTTALQQLSERIEIVEGDLRNPIAARTLCRDAAGATLFHCAGVIHPRHGIQELYDVNEEGTRSLLHTASKARVRRAVVVSSNSPVGVNLRRDYRLNEETPRTPYMSYGRSKLLMERVVYAYQVSGTIETVIVRPPWFYGPDQPPRQTLFFSMIRQGRAPIVGDGHNLRSMAYVDNICQGLLLCERTPRANGQTYWIADERPYSMHEIIDTVERLLADELGLPVNGGRLRLPYVAGELAFLADWLLQRAGQYHQKIHVLSEMNKTIACSINKARRELGYAPAIELEEGMRRSLRWCQAQGLAL